MFHEAPTKLLSDTVRWDGQSGLTLQIDGRDSERRQVRIAVLIPCYDEAATIGTVVRDFQTALPGAYIYVYDNNSKDDTARIAADASAIVRREERQGKGHVVRRMFSDVEADIYVMVDGDGTYHAPSAALMIERLRHENLDMVVGCRVDSRADAYRSGHRFGNAMLTGCVGQLFGRQFDDILSGYRVFSRRFVKCFPALSAGFETETEITVHALELKIPIAEVETPYGVRPSGSASKLSTYRDGFRILGLIVTLYRREQPIRFFGTVSAALMLVSLVLAWPLVVTFMETSLVPRIPTAILSTGLALAAMLAFSCGLILDTVTRGRQELKRLVYLSMPESPRRPWPR
jgi:glycosyltransferase involved in cell wall biosynthesis